MRILTIQDDSAAPGGSNNYRKQLAALLREKGIELSLFTFVIEDNDNDIPTYCYRYPGNIKGFRHVDLFYYNRSLIRALREWIGMMTPDIIHIHNNYRFPASVLTACKGRRLVIQTVHDFRILCWLNTARSSQETLCRRCLGDICSPDGSSLFTNPLDYLFHDFFPKKYLQHVLRTSIDCFITPSRVLESDLRAKGFNTVYLPNFVDLARYPVVSAPQNSHNVLFVGYLNESKGVDVLLRAFSQVVRSIPDVTLEILGKGPEEGDLRALSTSLGLDNSVMFLGEIPNAEVPRFYQKSHIVVLPSVVMENSPLIIYEAMASGRPVVASDAGGTCDLITEGENGFLFHIGDERDLSFKLIALLSDREHAKQMGENGRRQVESFYTPEKHLERYLSLIHTLIS